MELKINGKNKKFEEDILVAELLEQLKAPKERTAVEVNGMILEQEKWPEVRLKDNDKIEIISFVGGG